MKKNILKIKTNFCRVENYLLWASFFFGLSLILLASDVSNEKFRIVDDCDDEEKVNNTLILELKWGVRWIWFYIEGHGRWVEWRGVCIGIW